MTSTLVYFSPNGSTRVVASWIMDLFSSRGLDLEVLDLTGRSWNDIKELASDITDIGDLLIVGSPVYAGHPPSPLMEFLRGIRVRATDSSMAGFVYVTYGGVSAGSACRDVGRVLNNHGISLVGAIKLLSRHSLVFDPDLDCFSDRPGDVERDVLNRNLGRVLDILL
ncbi:MAG: flavodoxin family protein, partial [Promethearchaeota archaeon]